MKDMAVKFHDFTDFFCQDDKCKIDVGDPGNPIAAVERGKQVKYQEVKLFWNLDLKT